MDSPLRLIPTDPLDKLARTLEALLVVASTPLSVDELAAAADDDPERVEDALRLVAERFAEDRSGIVLEHVAGGWAFRAAREEAGACARGLSGPVLAAGHRADPWCRCGVGCREPPRARVDRRGRAGQRGRRSRP